MDAGERFGLTHDKVGCLPVVNWFLSRMGVDDVLERHLPHDDARPRIAPAAVIGLVVRNIVSSHKPLYAMGEWASAYEASLFGLKAGDLESFNDDRVGRMLDRLFDCDRASLITEVVVSVIGRFGIEMGQLHNDSTTVTFHGAYRDATGTPRGGKPTPAITFGFNKDHRPDLLTELREESSQFRALRLDSCLMVPARGRRRSTQGSGLTGGAIGGFAQRDGRSVGALSTA
jgi:hypothetical protein